jgi:hypothetical protein
MTKDVLLQHMYNSSPGELFQFAGFFPLLITLVLVDVALRGYSLWKAAKNNQSTWFIALFLLNSLGLIPLVYVAFFQKNKNPKKGK